MAVTLVQASVVDKFDECDVLIREHYDEVARHKDVMQLLPDREKYAFLDANDLLIGVFAYDAGVIVGYAVSFICNHIHYANLLYVQNDVLFVRKSHRKGRVGLALIRETENAARERGAKLITWHAKVGTPLEALLPRVGYDVQDIVYARGL